MNNLSSAFIEITMQNSESNQSQESFKLTPDQENAKERILNFIGDLEQRSMVLYGAAGTGKSSLTRSILDEIRTIYTVAGVAPTHKARKVLDRFLNKNAFITIKTLTVASLLNKMRTHSYIGTKKYKGGADTKFNSFDVFFIDEVSMVTDDDYNTILHFVDLLKKKVIFIGDKYQIPNPSQPYTKNKDDSYSKKDSIAFENPNRVELKTIVRQNTDNPLIEVYLEIRRAIIKNREPRYKRVSRPGIQFIDEKEKFYTLLKEFYGDLDKEILHQYRILAYTNDAVKNHNRLIRELFGYGALPVPGELLMGYNTIGWPNPVVENSQDYYLKAITPVKNHSIGVYKNLVGHILRLQEIETNKISNVFMPDLTSGSNQQILKELLHRSELVNEKFSTKDDFKKYMALKNKMIFMENIYRLDNEILPEPQFRVSNPMLFKSVTDIIEELDDGDRTIKDNKLTADIRERYPGLLESRYEDDKVITDIEKISDSFQVIEKDLDFGYAITVHKSQASSFETVFIDEADIEKIKDHWSYRLDAMIKGMKEQNQLKYVAYTRPKTEAIVFYRESVESC
jgi:DNA polymerase III delta prime subunit